MADFTFGLAVRKVRQAIGLTQAEFAATAGLSRTQLVRIERGQGEPNGGSYSRIVGALGFAGGYELLAAAGDTDAAKHLEGYKQAEARAKKLAAARERAVLAAPAASVPEPRRESFERTVAVDWRDARPRRQRLASATARGYGREHKRLRIFILLRDPWCPGVPEGLHGKELVRTTVMDHIVSLRNGGSTTPEGCRGLCRACNARKAVLYEGAGYMHRKFDRRNFA
jgi:transcriptional regulator with XRE-family HTH domain